MKNVRNQTLSLKLAAASAASALLLVSQAVAQQGAQQVDREQATAEFRQLDANNDRQLNFDEIKPRLESANLDNQWDEQRLLTRFDQDDSDALNQQEYIRFLSDVGQKERSEKVVQSREQVGERQVLVQPQQQQIEVDPKAPTVEVDQAEPQVAVRQQPAQVRVDPADPKVSVDQKEPKVVVRQAEPQVTVNVPEPEVEVIQREPDVNVQTGKPDVEVQQQEPKVAVTQGDPKVNVQQRAPDVSVQSARPKVVMDGKEQARVAVRDDQNAQVQVDEAQPSVEVGRGDPDVQIDSSGGGADVDVRQTRQGEQRQMQIAAIDRGEQQRTMQQTREPAGDPLDRVRITSLEGTQVLNREGQELGTVEDVVLSRQGNNPGIVITVGGILGIGGEDILIPLDQVALNNGRLIWETTMSTSQMRNSRFSKADYTPISRQDHETVGDLKQAR